MLFSNPNTSNNLISNLNSLKKVENSAWMVHFSPSTGVWFPRFLSWHFQGVCLCLFTTIPFHNMKKSGKSVLSAATLDWAAIVVSAWIFAGQPEFKNKIACSRHSPFVFVWCLCLATPYSFLWEHCIERVLWTCFYFSLSAHFSDDFIRKAILSNTSLQKETGSPPWLRSMHRC